MITLLISLIVLFWLVIIGGLLYKHFIANPEDRDIKKRKEDEEKIDYDNMFLDRDIRDFVNKESSLK